MKICEKVCIWWFCLLVVSAASCSIPAAGDVLAARPDTTITIQRTLGQEINPNFVGFSAEMSQMCNVLQLDAQNPFYAQLYKNLGSSVFYIEGATVDTSTWAPHGVSSCAHGHITVTEDLVDRIFAFARKIHWKVVWGLNLVANNPAAATDEAAYVVSVGSSQLAGFTIGNEPELYVIMRLRPAGWGYQNYRYEWRQYKEHILQRVRANIIGPDACCETGFFTNFVHDELPRGLNMVSHHFYTTMSTTPGQDAPSIPFLLSKRIRQKEHMSMQMWEDSIQPYQTPLVLSEVNSISSGGTAGVSNTLASALWADDLLFLAAEVGIHRVAFHSAPTAFYNPIDRHGNARPLYYGLLLFHYVTAQAHLLKTFVQTKSNLAVYALEHVDGKVSVIIINKDITDKIEAKINGGPFSRATSIRLTAPKITSSRDVVLGRRILSSKNTWSPWPVPVSVHDHAVRIEVPAGSVAVVTFAG